MAKKTKNPPKKKSRPRPAVTWRGKSLREMDAKEIKNAKKRLEEGWKAELPTLQLYSFTGLSEEQIEELKRRDPALASVENKTKGYLQACARINVARDIVEEGDVPTSKWLLEHTDDEFKPASKIDVRGQQIIVPIEDREQEIAKMFADLDFTNESTESTVGESDPKQTEMADGEDS